jgi:DNA polymerase III delta subunit
MVYLFLGPDTFSKSQAIKVLARQHDAEISTYDRGQLPRLDDMTAVTLFGGPRLFVLENAVTDFDLEKDIPQLAASPHGIVFSENKLDKRKSSTAAWLKHEQVTAREFAPPQGKELREWAMKQVEGMEGILNTATADYFLTVVLPPPSSNRFAETKIDLWQVYNELRKLCTYAAGQAISRQMIDDLTTKNTATESWDIANALADRNAKQVFVAMERFFETGDSGGDDKAKTIQLNALLAEQLRNILMVQDYLSRGVADQEILAQTLWKSGRLFVVKKLASRFKPGEVLGLIIKLERLDNELKTTTLPGRAVLELIMAQLS